jgi:hypothetical protein
MVGPPRRLRGYGPNGLPRPPPVMGPCAGDLRSRGEGGRPVWRSRRVCASSCCALCVGVPPRAVLSVSVCLCLCLRLYLCANPTPMYTCLCVDLPVSICLYRYTCICRPVSVQMCLYLSVPLHPLSTYTPVHLYLLPYTCVCVPPPVSRYLSLYRYLFLRMCIHIPVSIEVAIQNLLNQKHTGMVQD